MHLIRRTVFRAASSSPSTSFISQSRSINTSSSFLLRSKVQATGISPSVFRRFASDDASSPSSADGEQSSVSSAIDSAAETASTYASEAAESVSNASEGVADAAVGTAAAAGRAFQPREDRRESRPYERDNNYGDRNGGNRGGDRNGGGRGGYGGDRNGGGRGFEARSARPPPIVLTPTPSIYIGNLLFDITAADLQAEFGQYGEIKSAIIATDPRGMSKGFGYIEFSSVNEATAAIEAKHQTIYEGRRLVVNYQSKTRRAENGNPPSKTLFIGNLAFEMSDSDLNKLFRDIRNVIDVRVAIDRRTGQPRGFAHADFVDVESAVKGMETLKGQEVYGRVLRVDYSLGNRERAAGDNDRGFDRGSDRGSDRGGDPSF